jgi:prepilin-type N-terminal cleavage/methylation domain-containing protein
MSDHARNRLAQFRRRSRDLRQGDRGMTLPEVLISVTLTALLIAALSMSITVVLRQSDNTTGRVNNARSEQSVSLWMPSDLASADSVSTDSHALPCTLPCPPEADIGGSNALMLTWSFDVLDEATGNVVTTTTMVSYRYMQVGTEWVMKRVECTTVGSGAPTCKTNTVLHNLDGPPAGTTFVPGDSTPTWIIQVSQALDPASTGAPGETIPVDPSLKNKNGQRVVVTINGGGDIAGAGGGTNQISLSAGGTERKQNLATSDPSGVPPFIAARSRCGGNFALIVDTSGSINQGQDRMGSSISGTPNWSTVRGSIYKFIEAFEGTPVMLELVKFSTSATVLGAANGDEQKYYDMLDPAQVSALKSLVGYPNTAGGLQSSGSTNWEDAFYTLFHKLDGTVQPVLPKTVIFFTDGVPTNSRLQNRAAGSPAPTMDVRDVPLPGPNSTWYQVGWNRADRVMRPFDADVESLIGMYVGSASANSDWQDTQGYHLVAWYRGYHTVVQRANTIAYERGYHNDYQYNKNLVWERGYHLLYERNNNVQFQYASTGVAYEKKTGSSWGAISASVYFANNTTNDSTDNYRARVTGTPGTWLSTYGSTTLTQAVYDLSNTTSASTDGFRTVVTPSLSASWTTVTSAQYTGSNTTSDSSDGWRVTNVYSSPYDTWESATQGTYDASNTTVDSSDGWRTRVNGSLSSTWYTATQAQYNASNSTADNSDGWQISSTKTYSTPYDSWESVSQNTYNNSSNNQTPGEADGWRARLTGAPTSWTTVNQSEYDKSNQTADESDGYRSSNSYTSPYNSWETVDEATYNANNTTADASDGWKGDKVYGEPFTAYEAMAAVPTLDKDILGRFVQPVGTPVGPLFDGSGNVTNAETANLYSLSDYAALNSAMQAIALSECGGTLTIQTRLASTGGSAQDPFTYKNSIDQKTVQTTSQFRGGTFDFQTTSSVNPTIELQINSGLSHYTPVNWTCTAKGQPRSFTQTTIGSGPWKSITVNVAANEAVSCTQFVQWNP